MTKQVPKEAPLAYCNGVGRYGAGVEQEIFWMSYQATVRHLSVTVASGGGKEAFNVNAQAHSYAEGRAGVLINKTVQ